MNNQTNKQSKGIQKQPFKLSEAISILQRKHYGFLSRIFCCKCFYCCQVYFYLKKNFDFTLLTSKNRKGAFEKMVKKYLKSSHEQSSSKKKSLIMDPFLILVALLLGQQSQIYNELLEEVSNTNESTIFSKEDLQFYIPQLCTYLVFHEEMSNAQLSTFLERACKVDLHFSLRYYFFMKSLEIIQTNDQIKKLPIVERYNSTFRNKINLCYKSKLMVQNRHKILENSKIFNDESDQGNEINSCQIKENDNQKRQKKYRKSSFSSQCCSEFNQDSQQPKTGYQLSKEYQTINKYCTYQQKPLQLEITNIYTSSLIKSNDHYPLGLFQSTVNFFFDLVYLSQLLLKFQGDRSQKLESQLKQINSKFPSLVYLPFTKCSFILYRLEEYQGMTILNIVLKESRIFKTKERVPFKICVEVFYNPTINDQSSREKKIKSTIKSNHVLRRSSLFLQDIQLEIEGQNAIVNTTQFELSQEKKNIQISSKNDKILKHSIQVAQNLQSTINSKKYQNYKQIKKNIWGKLFQLKNLITQKKNNQENKNYKIQDNNSLQIQKNNQETKNYKIQLNTSLQIQKNKSKIQELNFLQNQQVFTENLSQKQSQKQHQYIIQQSKFKSQLKDNPEKIEEQVFGKSQGQIQEEIKQKSPYSRLQGYKIVSFIVKSNDDLRQECFAMQLLYQFQRIFAMQKLKIKLCPYEVMPLSHNSGIIEFISQAITIDQLMKKEGNLLFVRQDPDKLKNFIYSLVGYSLVTFMLQVKDRHNQNIMIKRDGTIIHIDFGFFLSNMPGQGVELQKKVPFKLTMEYIDALGGLKSKQFIQFRKLFYQGFNALRKHQHRILIITKLMYSSYGTTMKCFEKGDEAIEKLVLRFNPKKVRTDGELSLYCQRLVNQSIQNWRAKWYDRWQYFAQGILY